MTLEALSFTDRPQEVIFSSEGGAVGQDDTSKALMRIFDFLVEHDPDFTAYRGIILMMVFLAGDEGVTVSQVEQRTGLDRSTISRALGFLGESAQRGKRPPLGWVKDNPDPEDIRRNVYTLTRAGQRIKAKIEGLG